MPLIPDEVGSGVRHAGRDWREQIEFLGNVARNMLPTLWNRRQTRWPEVGRVFEVAGANAVPIVSLVSILVGLIIAFESAQTLANFGAQIYVVNMIGIVMVRELGPLLAAVSIGRTFGFRICGGTGYNEGRRGIGRAANVWPGSNTFSRYSTNRRGDTFDAVVDVFFNVPGDHRRRVGGVCSGILLEPDISSISASLQLSDIFLGVSKAVAFGAIVSAVGCLRGLQTGEGPSAVGVSTTRAVVSSIILVVIADAVFAVLFYYLKK